MLEWKRRAQRETCVPAPAVVLRSDTGVNWAAACFHAQQAAEKATKARLVVTGIDFSRSHAIDRLLRLLRDELTAEFDLAALEELTPWAVAGRYSEDIADPDEATTEQLVDAARQAVNLVDRLVQQAATQ